MLDKCVSQSHFFTVFGTITLKRSNTQKFLIFLFTATTFLKLNGTAGLAQDTACRS